MITTQMIVAAIAEKVEERSGMIAQLLADRMDINGSSVDVTFTLEMDVDVDVN